MEDSYYIHFQLEMNLVLVCFTLAAILLSIGTRPAAFAATAMVFIVQIFLGIGFLPIVRFIHVFRILNSLNIY